MSHLIVLKTEEAIGRLKKIYDELIVKRSKVAEVTKISRLAFHIKDIITKEKLIEIINP